MPDPNFTGLHSARLSLRRMQAPDLALFCDYRSRPEVARYQSWETFTQADGKEFLGQQSQLEPDLPGTWFQVAIVLKANQVLVGDCGLHCRQDDPRQAEVGITLAPEHQGQGYAAEALSCLLDYTFFSLDKHRVIAITDAANRPAAALLLRVGFRREGHFLQNVWFKGKWGDEYQYALLHDEWAQKREVPLTPASSAPHAGKPA
jgi:RimJ/RimL family protein N-acetyltransferase